MWKAIVVLPVALAIWLAPVAGADPGYVSCRDGYIAKTLADCPVIHKSKPASPPLGGGGGGGRRGLLGLGGLVGIL